MRRKCKTNNTDDDSKNIIIEMQTQISDRQMPTSSIEEQSSRYQVSLPYSTDIGNFINETADDFTKSLIVKRSNIPASNSHFNSHKKREN